MRALFELTISRTSSNEASSFPPTLSFKRKIIYTNICIILEISKQRVKRGWKYLGIWSSLWIRVSNILFRFRVQSEFFLLLVGESGKTRMHEPGNQVKNGPVSPSNDLSKALENTRGESARDACISLEFIDDPVALTPSQPLPALSKSLLDSGPLDRSSSSAIRFRMKDFAGNSVTINARSRIDSTSTDVREPFSPVSNYPFLSPDSFFF